MATYYRKGAVVEAAQHLEGRGACGGHEVRLSAKPSAHPSCPAEKAPAGAVGEHEDVIFALYVATCVSLDSYRGEVLAQLHPVTE